MKKLSMLLLASGLFLQSSTINCVPSGKEENLNYKARAQFLEEKLKEQQKKSETEISNLHNLNKKLHQQNEKKADKLAKLSDVEEIYNQNIKLINTNDELTDTKEKFRNANEQLVSNLKKEKEKLDNLSGENEQLKSELEEEKKWSGQNSLKKICSGIVFLLWGRRR